MRRKRHTKQHRSAEPKSAISGSYNRVVGRFLSSLCSARHVILSEVDASMRALSSLFPALRSGRSSSASSPLSLSPPSTVLDPLLYSSPSLDFIRRWNVLSFHQQRLAHWLNLNHLPQAWLYAQAARHDAEQMATLIRKEMARVKASLKCDEDDESGVESLAGLPLAAPSSASSASSQLSASHYLFFVLLELAMLAGIVVFFWMLSSYPHAVVAAIAKCLPQQIVQAMGLNRIGKRKDF